MLGSAERAEMDRLWTRKLQQDASGLPQSLRHRNIEPPSAEFLHALAAAARGTGGRLLSLEIEPLRQAEARDTLARLGLGSFVDFVLADAAEVLPEQSPFALALIDCEKDDYIRFFDMLPMRPGGIIVADNIISHSLGGYVAHVRSRPGVESITLAIGKGLEVTRVSQ